MEYKSFYKSVTGNEGSKCHYATRLDTYGCGCQHDCNYCYARSLLDFRGLWHAEQPAVADIDKIKRKLDKIPAHTVLRLGGMTDCFQPLEKNERVTLQTIEAMNEREIEYLIVTKSALVAEYISVMDVDLSHIQVTVTTLDDDFYFRERYEKASPPSQRVAAIQQLQDAGYDVAIRLSPLIESYMDFDALNNLGIEKGVVEFLRVNHWIEQWFKNVDFSAYTVKSGGYRHLPLDEKKRILSRVKIPNLTVCEDVTEHYEYWRNHINPNPDDCCNLRR